MKAEELLARLRGHRPRILVVGDVMLDGYWFGDAERISPEAPVPVVKVEREEYRPGGAASVAAILAELGADVVLIGATGRDEEASILRSLFQEVGLPAEGLVPTDRPTVRKIRVIARNQQLARLDWENPSPLSERDFLALLDRVRSFVHEVDGVVFQDYAKGVFSPDRIPRFVEACGDLPILVDPKPVHMDAFQGVTLLKPNRAEYGAWGRFPLTREGLFRAREALGVNYLLVTLGPEGMVLVMEQEQVALPSTRHEVFDVTGAGDAVLAGMAFALMSGLSAEEAAWFATFLAGREVMHLGATPISWDEVEKEARDYGKAVLQGIRRVRRAGTLS